MTGPSGSLHLFNLRRTSILGARVDNVKGITHNRGWARRRRGEMNKGGTATNEEAWGCWPCKQNRDRERMEQETTTQDPMTRQQTQQQWAMEDAEQLNTKATLKHILCGECTGLPQESDKNQTRRNRNTLPASRKPSRSAMNIAAAKTAPTEDE